MNLRRTSQDHCIEQAIAALTEAERLAGSLAFSRPVDALTFATLQSEVSGLKHEFERLARIRSREPLKDFREEWLEDSAWASVR